MSVYEAFVENIKRTINERGYKQRAIAEKAGFSEQGFSDMLNGRKIIKAADVPAICAALGIEPNDLFGFVSADKAS